MKPFKKTRLVEVIPGKSVKVEVVIRGDEEGHITISTKIGDEPANHRETSIYNPNVV